MISRGFSLELMVRNIMVTSFDRAVVQIVINTEISVMVGKLGRMVGFFNLGEVVVGLSHWVRDHLDEELLR